MATKMSDVLKELEAKKNAKGEVILNKFNKKNFNKVVLAMLNDPDYADKIVKKESEDGPTYEEILVSKNFRKWLKDIVKSLGVDSKELGILDTYEFKNVDGMYDLVMAAAYEYMKVGNKFDIPSHENFKGSIYVKDVPASKKVVEARNPADGTRLGIYETTYKPYKQLAIKSSAPKYAKTKKKLPDDFDIMSIKSKKK